MLFLRCAFCHKLVFRLLYASHRAKHTELLPDGQMTNHITVHPTGRYRGSLKGVPHGYLHRRCGAVTGMPEEIIRSYLVNPFLYGGGSFCCGCGDYMPYEELFWDETGESLADYFLKMQEEYLRVCTASHRPRRSSERLENERRPLCPRPRLTVTRAGHPRSDRRPRIV